MMKKPLRGFVGLVAMCLISTTAKAELYTSIYDVYFGGLRVGEADVALTLSGSSYHINIALRARGLADVFTNFEAEASMHGAISEDKLVPEKQHIVWSDGEKTKFATLVYADGRPVSYDTDSDWVNDRDVLVPLALEDVGSGSVDPISSMFASSKAPPCLVEQTLFDGLRMSKIKPLPDASPHLLSCRLKWAPLAGHSRASTEYAKSMSPLKVSYTQVTDDFLAPHKVLVDTRYGFVAMLLRTTYSKQN